MIACLSVEPEDDGSLNCHQFQLLKGFIVHRKRNQSGFRSLFFRLFVDSFCVSTAHCGIIFSQSYWIIYQLNVHNCASYKWVQIEHVWVDNILPNTGLVGTHIIALITNIGLKVCVMCECVWGHCRPLEPTSTISSLLIAHINANSTIENDFRMPSQWFWNEIIN